MKLKRKNRVNWSVQIVEIDNIHVLTLYEWESLYEFSKDKNIDESCNTQVKQLILWVLK